MEQTPELTKALSELKRLTGLTMQITADTPEETAAALEQIRCLCTAYREKYNKNDFLLSLMKNGIPAYDIYERAGRLHIPVEEKRVIYLLKTKELTDTIIEILRNLFPHRAKTYLVPVSKDILSILHPVRSASSEDEVRKTAHIIVDTLNTEALAHVQIAYSGVIENLAELPGAFRESTLALKVGELFYSEQTVFPYNELGIGRLIYQLPIPLCKMFIREIFDNKSPDDFDEETLVTIDKFFENSLNVSETSRQLYIHRNTLVYRLDKLQKSTGLDLRVFEDAITFKIALMVVRYMKYMETLEY